MTHALTMRGCAIGLMAATLALPSSRDLLAADGTATGSKAGPSQSVVPPDARAFLKSNCFDCHSGDTAEAGVDLTELGNDFSEPKDELRWIRIIDRVEAGEMPPADSSEIDTAERSAFTSVLGDSIRRFQHRRDAQIGRVQARRLTRKEIERSLHDLLGIDVPLAYLLPEESRNGGFSTMVNNQGMSHFQLQRHLSVVDLALDEAFRRALYGNGKHDRDFAARDVARRNPRRRCREPEMLNGKAVVWNAGTTFYGRVPATTAPRDGWYRFGLKISALNTPSTGGVWTTVRAGQCVSSAPLLERVTEFEAQSEPIELEFDAWLPRGHMLEIRPGDRTLRRASFAGGQIGAGEGEPQKVPGIAIHLLTMERVHQVASDDQLRELVIGDLEVVRPRKNLPARLISSRPRKDAAMLLRGFAGRAFRRPANDEQVQKYVDRALAEFDEGRSLKDVLRFGYRAILCSPRFLYLSEDPGRLDDFAIASRLSYLLTGSMPDQQLWQLATAGKLTENTVLKQQVNRLLADSGSRRFIEDFAAEWLDLDQIDFTEPDRKLVQDFDGVVKQSMLDETHTYLDDMLTADRSVTRLIQSDYTYLNSRLARFYGVQGVEGDELRKVRTKPQDHRGGLLSHGAILKVTANGTNTSPVVRGVWVSERILGVPIQPPPDNVPAIEPDIRGAQTIRDQLAKHRSQDTCASCHVKIDPPGFALENYDPAGRWRDRYLEILRGRRTRGAKIDASYDMPDGQHFKNVEGFKTIVAGNPKLLAANVAEKLLTYATGAPISYADREEIERIVESTRDSNYGLKSILTAAVCSDIFLKK